MPICAYSKCGQWFETDAKNPNKAFCNRSCSCRATAEALKGKPGIKRLQKREGRGRQPFRITPFYE